MTSDKAADLGTDEPANAWDMTPLFYAAWKGHAAAVAVLLENGASANMVDSDRTTPLVLAADEGHTAIVALLIENGARVDASNNAGDGPLLCAAFHGHTAVVGLLLAAGATFENGDSTAPGGTALHSAARKSHAACVRALLAATLPSGEDKRRHFV